MKKIYISASLRGGLDPDFEFVKKLGEYLKEKGYKILDEHVVVDPEKSKEVLERRIKEDGKSFLHSKEPWLDIRRFDIEWVDSADLLIAFVNNPSLGVGMEIERALLREDRGLKPIPVLAFVRKNKFESLSWMVRGIKNKMFKLVVYEDFKDIIEKVNLVLHFRKF